MVDYTTEQLANAVAEGINKAGAGRFGYSSYSKNTVKDDGEKKAKTAKTAGEKFNTSVDQTAKAMQILHGNTDQLSNAFYKMLGSGALASAAMLVVNSLTDMSRTFTKMTDIGQNFGGSILKMQELAGDSQLSMEQFTASITKASTVVAQMSGDQVKGVEAFNKYQTGVRNSLKQQGYFGMSLSQLTEMSAEHADTLRQTYQWDQLDEAQRASSSSNFIKNVSAMATATGKNRDALAKQTAELLKAPRTASALANMNAAQQQSVQGVLTMVNGISEQAGTALSQLIGEDGRIWNVGFGKDAIDTGMTTLLEPLKEWNEQVMGGVENLDPERFAELGVGMREAILRNSAMLRAFPPGSTQRAAGENLLKFAQSLAGLDPKKFAEKMREAQKAQLEGTTQSIQMFETTMNEVTGSFRKGFYASMLDMLAPMKDGKRDTEGFQKTLDNIKSMFERMGAKLGTVFGAILEFGLPKIEMAFNLFVDFVTEIVATIDRVHGWIQSKLEWLGLGERKTKNEKGEEVTTNPAANIASVVVAGLGVALFAYLRRKWKVMTVKADTVNLYGKPGAGFFGGGGADLDGGGDGKDGKDGKGKTAADGKPKGRMGRFWQGTKDVVKSPLSSMGGMFKGASSAIGGLFKNPMGIVRNMFKGFSFGSMLKGVGKGFWGLLAGLFIDPILNMFGNFKGKDSISSMVSYAGYGSMIGSIIPGVGTMVGALVGGIVGLIVENFQDITGNIGALFSGMGTWIADLVNGVVNWFVAKLKDAVPDWVKKFLNMPTCEPKADETKPPAADDKKPAEATPPANPLDVLNGLNNSAPLIFPPAVPVAPPPAPLPPVPVPHAALFNEQLPRLTSVLASLNYDPTKGPNGQTILDQMGKATPAMMAETIRLIKTDPANALLPTGIDDPETFTSMNDNLLQMAQVINQRSIDEQRRNELADKSLEELNTSIKEQTEVMAALLNRGNNQRDDANRKSGNSLLS